MQPLTLGPYSFRFKNRENKTLIFDPVRKKFVVLQPEEWVRQHVVKFLLEEKGFPIGLVQVEKQLQVNQLKKRYDVVVYNPDGSIHLLVECKAPYVPIDQLVFDQIARYNMRLESTYLMVTNGLEHYFCMMDHEHEKYRFLPQIPDFSR